MEPVDKSDFPNSPTAERPPPPKTNSIERAVIGKAESEKLNGWLAQLTDGPKRFIAVTKSDLINFLIRTHRTDLTAKEVSQIRSFNYNPVRHMNWIAQELKDALINSDMTRVAALQNEIKGIELSVTLRGDTTDESHKNMAATTPKTKRVRASKVNSHEDLKRPSGAAMENKISNE